MRTILTSLPVAFLCVLGCSSSPATGDGGADGGGSACPAVDVCGKVTLAHVNMLCGISATQTTPTSMQSSDPGLPSGDICGYKGTLGGQVVRDCFTTAAGASFFFGNEKKMMIAGVTQTDVTGVGDQAFLRVDMTAMQSKLYAVKANLLVVVTSDWGAGGQMMAQQCLSTLANEALAL